MQKLARIFSMILFAVLSVGVYSIAEEITLTTYYPAPYGAYEELSVDRNLTNNSDAITGLSIDIDESGTNAGTVTGLSVDVSGVGSGTRYAATFQGGNVGIGTTAPNEELEVDGTIRTNTMFNFNGNDGYTATFTVVTQLERIGASPNMRVTTRTITVEGGIITDVSNTSTETLQDVFNP